VVRDDRGTARRPRGRRRSACPTARRAVEHRAHLVGLVHVVDALLDERDALEPMPVSMFLFGSSPTMRKSYFERTSSIAYCMKTRFQIST
jgi:hypothetical protein